MADESSNFSEEDSIQSGDLSSEIDEDEVTEVQDGNPKLADAIAKVLRMANNVKDGKSVVLSKAKLYTDEVKKKKTCDFEIVEDSSQMKSEVKIEEDEEKDVKPVLEDIKPEGKSLRRKLKIYKLKNLRRGRLKPSPLDKEKEKPLVKIATKGVIQLFNAVRQQQVSVDKELKVIGYTEGKREKVLKQKVSKESFLELIQAQNKRPKLEMKSKDEIKKEEESIRDEDEEVQEIHDEDIQEVHNDEPAWQVLRDNFMMDAKLKDWDKKDD